MFEGVLSRGFVGRRGRTLKPLLNNMFPPYYKARSDVSVYVFCLDVLGTEVIHGDRQQRPNTWSRDCSTLLISLLPVRFGSSPNRRKAQPIYDIEQVSISALS